jgi:NAD(P)-dependent dehydrogenase (short-subunit alcohol dehydrogenase family)
MNLIKEVIYEAQNWWTACTWTEKNIPNLEGKTILVTGATDGVGYEAARAFAEHGARVIVHGRNEAKAKGVIEDFKRTASPNAELHYLIADLTDFDAVKRMADEYKSRGWPLHVMLNNAGIQAPAGFRGQKTPGGFEVTMSSNHFGPFYLALQLLDVLKASAPSRLVFVNSVGSQLVNPPLFGGNSWCPGVDWFLTPGMNWDDLKGTHYPDSDWWQYSRTKLMNLMTGKEMARRLAGTGVEVFIAHPGLTRTDHFGKADTDVKWSSAGVERFANSFWGTEAKMGAIPLMFACTETSLAGRSGSYVGSPELGPVDYFQARVIREPNAPLARDAWACRRLVDASIAILKEIDPDLPNAEISPDGRVLLDKDFGSKVLPADGTSGFGPRQAHTFPVGWQGIPDAEHKAGRSASSIGRRPAPFLAAFRYFLMAPPADI